MHINEVKTAFKIADVKYIPGSTKLEFAYLENLVDENGKSLPSTILKTNVSRVYLIVVDGIIKKIGASQDKGGIKGTFNIYKDGGVKGRPSIRSFGIWYFLYHNILESTKSEEELMKEIIAIPQFQEKTARLFVNNLKNYKDFLDKTPTLKKYIEIASKKENKPKLSNCLFFVSITHNGRGSTTQGSTPSLAHFLS